MTDPWWRDDSPFGRVMAASLDGFAVLEPVVADRAVVDFRLLYLNAAAKASLHLDSAVVAGQTLSAAVPEAVQPGGLVERLAAVAATGDAAAFVLRLQATARWFRTAAARVDNVVTASFHDVTAERLARRHLEDSERRLRLFASVGHTVVYTVDRRFRYTGLIADRVGFDPAWVIGKTDEDLFDETSAAAIRAVYREVITSGHGVRRDMVVKSRRREAIQHFDMVVEPVRGPGGAIEELVCAANEVTERVLAHDRAELARAEAVRANHSKSRFLAAASHDLGQPIFGMRLFLDRLVRLVAADEEPARLCAAMGESVNWLERMVASLLAFAALETGKVAVNRQPFAIDGLLNRIGQDLALEAEHKGLRLKVRPNADTVDSDPVLLERILRNLAANAIRYTSRGGVLLAARRRGAVVCLEVWDTGFGIPLARQQEIFNEYSQIGNPASNPAHGMGLGLAIVARTADLLGHRLAVRSLPGRGSVFRVEVPVVD